MSQPLLINNVPEVLRLSLEGPVTVVKDNLQIAALISFSHFGAIGGDVNQLKIDSLSDTARAQYELGEGTPKERTDRFVRLILHAVHSKTFLPLFLSGQPVAVVMPPIAHDRNAVPSGPWINITPA